MHEKEIIKRLINEERDPFGKLTSCDTPLYSYSDVIESLQEGETEEMIKEMHREGLVLVEFSNREPRTIRVTPDGVRYLYKDK